MQLLLEEEEGIIVVCFYGSVDVKVSCSRGSAGVGATIRFWTKMASGPNLKHRT